MNLRVDPVLVDPAEPRTADTKGRRPLRAALTPISGTVTAVFFDAVRDVSASRPRLAAELGGVTLAKPMLSTELDLRGGARRHVIFVGRPAASLLEQHLDLRLGTEVAARIDPAWLQSPVKEPLALVDGLSDAGRLRLLKVFLTTGVSLFGQSGAEAFVAAATELLDLLGARPIAASSCCRIGAERRLLSYRLPLTPLSAPTELVVLRAARSERLGGSQAMLEATERGTILHVLAGRMPSAPAEIVALADLPLRLADPASELPMRALAPWLERRDRAVAAWVQGLLADAGTDDAAAEAQLREIRIGQGANAELAIRHLSGTPRGILLAAEIADPFDLVDCVRVERAGKSAEITPTLTSTGVVSAVGFLPLPAGADHDTYCLRLIYRSGRSAIAAEGVVEAYAGGVPATCPGCPEPLLAEAVAQARLAVPGPSRRFAVEEFGTQPEAPALALVTEAGGNLDVVRARAAMLRREPGWRAVEVIYRLHADAQAEAALRAIAMTEAIFGVPHRAVIVPADTDRSEALLAVLGTVSAATALCLGADVLPDTPGWLDGWRSGLGGAAPGEGAGMAEVPGTTSAAVPAVLAGVLLGADGSVQSAGGAVLRDAGGMVTAIERHHLGLPTRDLPSGTEATDLVSADCVGLGRDAIDRLLQEGAVYPDPDLLLARLADDLGSGNRPVLVAHHLTCSRFAEPGANDPIEAAIALRALAHLTTRGDRA